MQAVILAAGESSRFWPLNKGHKSQIKLLGKPLIYWTIRGLAENGVKDLAIIISPNSTLRDELNSISNDLGVNLSYFVQEKPLGTGNAISMVKDFIKEPFWVLWPYEFYLIKDIISNRAKITLFAAPTNNPEDYGILKMEQGRVVEICENPLPGKAPSNLRTLGIYFLNPDFFSYYEKLKKHHPEDFIDAINLLIKDKDVGVVTLEKEPPTLKYPWNVLGILKLIFESGDFKPTISSSAKIGENTVISGSVYIGNNCQIGPSNILRGPLILEDNVKTGAFFEIKNSIVQEGTHFHSGYVGDSVIGKNCRFGAGFITANRRLDRGNIKAVVRGKKIDTGLTYFGIAVGDNSKFGIHAGTMPGKLIGSNSVIGPGSLVSENIEDNTSFFTEFKAIKKKLSA
ncbi:MAG: hypothetical protein A3A08_02880 [Candidatus Nealsonbacteria bacterium RIFCSPLOWO2_01_FULL_41_9]|uniref:Nucleotidyl transferase domain-containing protein n=1 Tax=Candidatus Nealsonbacteria bacterium RIFCSPLOWO2_01_FULL_41_9 TaxID=1801671 RepID=A0A1G2EDC9_9BACT|nr:MAG: hypothetical protein A3A08_02880 [Candidatus Nealsonbacteria bacterium RIFCSPLOWO2_01_FULL_41_9]